jgi:dTDP-4-dehydrorhamnose reductase
VRVLVTGVKGQLGYDVVNELTKRGHEAVGVDIDEMDITDAISVQHVVSAANVDSLVHCAAYTAVDKAEDFPEICMKVNVEGTRNIAKACSELYKYRLRI